MSISFSGTGSGLPVSDWIDALMSVQRQPVDKLYTQKASINTSKSTLGTVEAKFSSLRSSIEKLTDAKLGSTFDLFGRKSVTSSDSAIATATASNDSALQNITLKVTNIATATKATSTTAIGRTVDPNTDKITTLANNSGSTGTFSLYVDNKQYQFTIDANSTINSVIDDINNTFSTNNELTASFANGKLKIDVDNNQVSDFKMGSNSDTSNFLNITQLNKVAINPANPTSPSNIDYLESANSLSVINTQGTIAQAGGTANFANTVNEGTFTIGGSTFTIDTNTTFSDLIADINSDTDAGVIAQFDVRTNKFILTSKDPGATTINVQNGTSNFLTAVGLTTVDNQIATNSQTLGDNAVIELNGNQIEAATNTITSDISGIAGLTINLKGTTPSVTGGTNTINISVGQDTSSLTDAVNGFISAFNNVINEIDNDTANNGSLHSEYSLVRLRSNLRSTVTSQASGISTDSLNSLALIGITTGAVGTSVKSDTSNLKLDSTKFLDKLASDPDGVKKLLIGNDSITGILGDLETKVADALDPVSGYFATKEDSYDSMITDLNKTIQRNEDRLTAERKRLTDQFNQMDQMISKMKAQGSAISSL